MEFWKDFTKACKVFSAQIDKCSDVGVTKFLHDNTGTFIYKAFMRRSVKQCSSFTIPINWYFTITWAVSVSHFPISTTVWIFLSFLLSCSSEARWPTAEWHGGDSHLGWDITHHSHVTAHTLWQISSDSVQLEARKMTKTDILWPTTQLPKISDVMSQPFSN